MLAAHRVLHAPVSPASYNATVLADSPVAFWPLNESSGTTAQDQSGNGYNGTYSGGYTLGATGIGDGETSVIFNGSNGYVNGDLVAAAMPYGTFSVEWWSYLTSVANGGRAFTASPGNNGYAVGVYPPATSEWVYTTKAVSDNVFAVSSVQTNVWQYVALSVNSGTAKLYVNASLVSTLTGLSNGNAPNDGFEIGRFNNGSSQIEYVTGSLAKVAVYSYALTSTQISNHYAAA